MYKVVFGDFVENLLYHHRIIEKTSGIEGIMFHLSETLFYFMDVDLRR